MYTVKLVNHGMDFGPFKTQEAAMRKAGSMGFEATITRNRDLVARFSPISGWTRFNR